MTNKKIRIRFFIGHFHPIYTGAGKSMEKLIFALDKQKFDYEIVTAYKKGLKRKEEHNGYTIIRKGHGFFNERGYLSAWGKVDFALSGAWYNLLNRDYDILKFIGSGQVSLLSILVAKLLGKPVVNKTTGVGDDDPRKLSETRVGRWIIKLYNTNTFHWVISKEIYDLAIKYTNWDKNSLYLIPNTVQVFFKDYNSLLLERRKYEKQTKMNFLFVGVLDKRKGVHILLDIWEEIGNKATLTLCGPRGNDADLNLRIDHLSMDSVRLMGELTKEDIQIQYLASDYFLFPSNREGLPNVILESMSYGLPVIANNIEGVVDYLLGHDNERGFVIQDNLLETWIDTITSIIDEKNYNENKAKQAYDWVVDNASFEAVEKKMGSLYTKLTNK